MENLINEETFFNTIKSCKSLSPIINKINNNSYLLNFVLLRTNYLDKGVKIIERLYNIKYNLTDIQFCQICKINILKWNKKGYYNNTCGNADCIKITTKNTITNNFDGELKRREKIKESNKNKTPEEKKKKIDKIKETLMNKYGVDSYAKTKEFKDFMIKNYGYISPFELEKTHEKSKETLIERYDVDHNFKIKEVIEKRKNTFLEKYDEISATKNTEIKNKTKKTNLRKYGFVSPIMNINVKNKSNKTLLDNWGVDTPLKNKDILLKYESTMFNRYGVKYWIQDSNNFDNLNKNGKHKKYTLPNGEEVNLQGYEDYVLDLILLKNFNIDDIYIKNKNITEEIGVITYQNNNKEHKYYPDFYIKSINLIVEVKSTYTYSSDIIINKLKRQACIDKKLNFEFIILDKKTYNTWKNKK